VRVHGAKGDALPAPAAALATVASGWALAQAFPPAGQPAVAFVALVPFVLAVRLVRSARVAVLLGALWMLVFAWGINDWFPRAVARYCERSWPVGFAFFLGVTLLSAAPASMVFAWVVHRLARWRRDDAPTPLAPFVPLLVAAAWAAGELLRTRVLGDPWGVVAWSQPDSTALVQVAALAGACGVGFVVMLGNAGLAEVVLLVATPARRRRGALAAIALSAVVTIAALAAGSVRLGDLERASGGEARDVVVVQGDIDFRDQWRKETHRQNLEAYLTLTQAALAEGPATLVVWPENAVTAYLGSDTAMRAAIAGVIGPASASLVAGAPRLAGRAPDVYRNSVFLLGPDGGVRAWYDKQRLLPFAEYQPLMALDAMARDFGDVREFSPGPEDGGLLDTGAGALGVVVCNEALFAEPPARRVEAGAELLLALTNDSWVGETKFAEQAFAAARLRAVEQGRWLVRASTSGPSALVDPAGRVALRTRDDFATALRGRVVLRSERTVYSRVGDAFAWSCVLAVAAALAFEGRRLGEHRE
jgi:apolipoprotein N-acyltransferase